MKRLIVVTFAVAIMLAAFGGVLMAQPFGTVQFGDVATGICTGPVDIPIEVGEVADLTSFYIAVLYDPTAVIPVLTAITSPFDPGAHAPQCGYPAGGGMEACLFNPVGRPAVSIASPVAVANLHLTRQTGATTPSQLYFNPADILLPPSGPVNDVGATKLNGIPYPAIVIGPPLDIPACPLAIGSPLGFGGNVVSTSSAPPLFAFAALLGLSGLILTFRYRRQARQLV